MRAKINWLNAGGLLILGLAFMAVTLYYGERNKGKEIAYLRTVLIEEKKGQLNDLMANAYSVVKSANFWTDGQRALNSMRFGPDGKNYYFVFDREGVCFVDPEHPDRVGKKQLDLEDADGRKIVREIIRIADQKGEGLIEYRWTKSGAVKPVRKLTTVKLYKEWNWIICTGVYLDDIEKAVAAKESELTANTFRYLAYQAAIMVVILMGVLLISLWLSRRISVPIGDSLKGISDISRHVAVASEQVLASSKDVAANAAAQSVMIKKSLDSLDKIVSGAKSNAKNTGEIDRLLQKTDHVLVRTDSSMKSLNESMLNISQSSEHVSRIVGFINDLAFKIRLIALNASVEASRAGEAGNGFTVIADEIRAMADQSAEAGKTTSTLIAAALEKIGEGANQVVMSSREFAEAKGAVEEIAALLQVIAVSGEQQDRELARIHEAIAVLEKATDKNTHLAEESALTADAMSTSAEQMNQVVAGLVGVIGDRRRAEDGRAPDRHALSLTVPQVLPGNG